MIVYQHNHRDEFVGETQEHSGNMPHNCVNFPPPLSPYNNVWPVLNAARTAFDLTTDHRKRTRQEFSVHAQDGTPYWLAGDTWQTPARYMKELGPLPAGALLMKPEKAQTEIDAERIAEIQRLLDEIDRKSARPLRAVAAGTATDDDRTALADLEQRAVGLRGELSEIGG